MAHRVADISEDHDPDADWSLPGWLYTDAEYFDVEVARVIPEDLAGELAPVLAEVSP